MNPTRIFFKNILFATDLSPAASAVVPYALEIARLYGSKIYVVHIKTGEWDKLQEQEADRLKSLLKGVSHDFLVEGGDVRTMLLELVGLKGIDLIVVGTHGRTGLGRVLLGSVAGAILREAPCPVLTVGLRLIVDPKWTLKIKEVLYATDLTAVSAPAARYAISLAQENQARLTILNVTSEAKAGEMVGSGQQAASITRQLQELLPPDAKLWCQPTFMVESGEPAEKILDVAWAYKADMIVLGIRQHSVAISTHLSRPTAQRVVAGAACPVLTIRG